MTDTQEDSEDSEDTEQKRKPSILSGHIFAGCENAKTGETLAVEMNCSRRSLSQIIEALRRSGEPIASSVGGDYPGYFFAQFREELEKSCESMTHHAQQILQTVAAMKRTAQTLPRGSPEEQLSLPM